MKKQNFSLTLNPKTIELIDSTARKHGRTSSSVARMLIELIHHVPSDSFCCFSPLPYKLGLSKEAHDAAAD